MVFGQKWQFLQLLFFSAKYAWKMSFTLFYNEKTPFLAIKTRKSKSRKIALFPKGLTHGFSSKMAIFLTSFFQTIKAKEMSFTIFQNEKTPFQVIKTRRSKSRKITIFPKELSHGFGPKMPFFSTSLFQATQARKMSFTIFQNEKTPFQTIKRRSSKSRKIAIFPKGLTHGYGPKMTIFPTSFFQAKQAREMSFTIFQNEKTPFQVIKTRSLRSRKIAFFPKRLTHGFSPKMAIFKTSFFQAIQARKRCFTIFQNEKTAFQAINKEVETLDKLPSF